MEEFLDTQEAADFIKHSVSTLESWRADGIGPKWYKPSNKVIYLKDDLKSWVLYTERLPYFIGSSDSGKEEIYVHTPEDSFSLRNGGGAEIVCYLIQNKEEAIAFVLNKYLAEKIVALLNKNWTI